MIFRTLKNLAASGNLAAQAKMMKIMKYQGSMIFYHAGIDTGLLAALAEPLSLEEAAAGTGITDRQLLSSLMDLGCSLDELSCRRGKYRLKGPMSKALVASVPIRELMRETVLYHAHVARHIGTYLTKGEKGDYLKDFGGVIAESSRALEPLIKTFIYHTVKKSTPLSILEIGCGAGEYLRYYVDINRSNHGMAIDIDPSAVTIAREKLRENKIENNFTVVQDNIKEPVAIRAKTFDLVTSFSNLHYFSDSDLKEVFKTVHGLLNEKGRFILATGFKSADLSSSYYDLIFSATQGLYPFRHIVDVMRELEQCGFRKIKTVRIMGESFQGIVAYK